MGADELTYKPGAPAPTASLPDTKCDAGRALVLRGQMDLARRRGQSYVLAQREDVEATFREFDARGRSTHEPTRVREALEAARALLPRCAVYEDKPFSSYVHNTRDVQRVRALIDVALAPLAAGMGAVQSAGHNAQVMDAPSVPAAPRGDAPDDAVVHAALAWWALNLGATSDERAEAEQALSEACNAFAQSLGRGASVPAAPGDARVLTAGRLRGIARHWLKPHADRAAADLLGFAAWMDEQTAASDGEDARPWLCDECGAALGDAVELEPNVLACAVCGNATVVGPLRTDDAGAPPSAPDAGRRAAGVALETAARDLIAVVDDMNRELGHVPSGYYLSQGRFDALRAALATPSAGGAQAPEVEP